MKIFFASFFLILFSYKAQALTCLDVFSVLEFKPKNIQVSNQTESYFSEVVLNLNHRIKVLEDITHNSDKKVVLSSKSENKNGFQEKMGILSEVLQHLSSYRRQIQASFQLYLKLDQLKKSKGIEIYNSSIKAYIATKNASLLPDASPGLIKKHNESIESFKNIDLILNAPDYLAASFGGLSRIVDMFSYRILELEHLSKRMALKESDLSKIDLVINDFFIYNEVLQHMVFKNFNSVQTALDTLQSSFITSVKIANSLENKKDNFIKKELSDYMQTHLKFPYVDVKSTKDISKMKDFEKQDALIASEMIALGVTPSHLTQSHFRFFLMSEPARDVFVHEVLHRLFFDYKKSVEDPLMFFWTRSHELRFPKENSSSELEVQTAKQLKEVGITERNVWMYFDLASAEAQFFFMQIAKQQLESLAEIESL